MLRATLRTKSFALSLLVHGTVVGAALVLAEAVPRPGGGRPLEIRVAAHTPEDAFAPDATPQPAEELEFDVSEELPPALEVAIDPPEPMDELEPLPVLPAFEDPRAPFASLPDELDLRARPAPAPAIDTAPAAAQVAPLDPAPASKPTEPELASTEPVPGPESAVVASSPAPLAGATPLPDYPASWARRGWVGEVTIELDIAPDGSVSAARVVTSSGFPRLDELARTTLATWRFAPAVAGGAAVPSKFRQRVEFRAR